MDISTFLDDVKFMLRIDSDRQLAHTINVDNSTIVRWRQGKSLPTDQNMLELCASATSSPQLGLMLLNIWRSEGDAKEIYQVIHDHIDEAWVSDEFQWYRPPGSAPRKQKRHDETDGEQVKLLVG